MKIDLKFENDCHVCGGIGCSRDGKKCFLCEGVGTILTQEGKALVAFLSKYFILTPKPNKIVKIKNWLGEDEEEFEARNPAVDEMNND